MATIYKILDPVIETLWQFITKYNSSIENLNTAKLEASDITGKQDTLLSGTNIKTVNSISLLGSGDIAIPALTDGDKWDITVSSSTTVWTIDNDAVTNTRLANMANGTIKGRTTAGSGDPEDLTGTQATALLDTATTSLKGLMSSIDKTKLDSISSSWSYVNLSQVSNTWASQETLYTTTLPANTLGTNGIIEWEIYFSSITTNSSARSVNIEVFLWASSTSFQINPTQLYSYNFGGIVKFRISGTGSTSSQKIEIISSLSHAVYYWWNTPPATGLYWFSNTTIDTTASQTLTIKTNPSGSNVTRTAESIVIRKII